MFILYKVRYLLDSLKNKYRINKYKIKVEKNTVLNGEVQFLGENKGGIIIGKDTRINSGKQYNQIGGDTRTIIRTIENGQIIIGNNVGISNSAFVARKSIIIEDDVRIGGSCKVYDNDFHSLEYIHRMQKEDKNIKCSPVCIKKGAFVGAGTLILKGVTIGEKSIIGAGSVVTTDVPDCQIWAGNPAKFVKKIELK